MYAFRDKADIGCALLHFQLISHADRCGEHLKSLAATRVIDRTFYEM
jgi:hypothetical protein